jgi:hypothetical protein
MRLNPKTNTPDKDIVYTPEPLAIDIINHYNPQGRILDPCRGGGAFFNNLDNADWCEIAEGKDFFDYHNHVDWIITNPPWSLMRQFLQHGMSIADNIVYLTSINHYTTKRRIQDMQAAGFGIKEFFCVATPPKPWPQSGFQLAAVHTARGYEGPIIFSFNQST